MTVSKPAFPLLTPPSPYVGSYTLRGRSARIARDWERMARRVPTAVQDCYEHLAAEPRKATPRRVFALRGTIYRGLWEYEVTGGERLFYLPDAHDEPEMSGWEPDSKDEQERVCLVFECGGHMSAPRRF